MATKIVYTNEKGIASIVIPSPNFKGSMKELASRVVPAGISYKIIDDSTFPVERRYRDAWVLSGEKLDIDMPKARAIFLDNVRVLRNAKLSELDVEVVKAVEKGESTTSLAIEKQRLRDLPETLSKDLEKCTTVEEFKDIKVEI